MTITTKLHQQFCSKGDNFILRFFMNFCMCEIIRKAQDMATRPFLLLCPDMVDFCRS